MQYVRRSYVPLSPKNSHELSLRSRTNVLRAPCRIRTVLLLPSHPLSAGVDFRIKIYPIRERTQNTKQRQLVGVSFHHLQPRFESSPLIAKNSLKNG